MITTASGVPGSTMNTLWWNLPSPFWYTTTGMPASVGWVLRTEERSKRLVRVLPAAMQANPFLATIPSHGR